MQKPLPSLGVGQSQTDLLLEAWGSATACLLRVSAACKAAILRWVRVELTWNAYSGSSDERGNNREAGGESARCSFQAGVGDARPLARRGGHCCHQCADRAGHGRTGLHGLRWDGHASGQERGRAFSRIFPVSVARSGASLSWCDATASANATRQLHARQLPVQLPGRRRLRCGLRLQPEGNAAL